MKKKIIAILINLFAGVSFSFQTSSESVNPFNQFISPSGGVNMYSGDVAYSHPLVTLPGRAGMNASVALAYSSNIYSNVRASNEVAPTSWVGLGWNLSYGSIRCDHKGTKTHTDDEFIWVSPAGVGSKILKKSGKYYIKEDPYTKIEPHDVNGDGVFDGWIVTAVDGKKMKYGNLGFTDNRDATRWTFAWGDRVGTASDVDPVRYPYQWDLSEITDLCNNAIKYYYDQEKEYFKVGNWISSVQYTKAAYPRKIETPEGKRIEFERESKNDEAYDPYIFENEPDGFMELYESTRLKRIKVYLSKQAVQPVNQYDFTYTTINGPQLGSKFKKSLLTGIIVFNGVGTNSLGTTNFSYNTDYIKADNENPTWYDPNYNYGALATVKSSTGGTTAFEYLRKNINATKTTNFTTISGSVQAFKGGITNDGNPYYLVQSGDKIYLFQWNGSEWVRMIDGDNLGNPGGNKTYLHAGKNYFIIGNDQGGIIRQYLWGYHWNGNAWVNSKVKVGAADPIPFYGIPFNNFLQKDIVIGDDCFAMLTRANNNISNEYVYLFQWNGEYWETANGLSGVNLNDPHSKIVYLQKNYCVITSEDRYVHVYNRNQTVWSKAYFKIGSDPRFLSGGDLGYATLKGIFCGNDYFGVSHRVTSAGVTAYIRLFQWNSQEAAWVSQPLPEPNGGYTVTGSRFGHEASKNMFAMNDYCIITSGVDSKIEYLNVLKRTGSGWDWAKVKYSAAPSINFNWNLGIGSANKTVYPGENSFAVTAGVASGEQQRYLFVFKWNGNEWVSENLPVHANDPGQGTIQTGTSLGSSNGKSVYTSVG